jgi:outer membrane lipoprotein-sorting protein
MLMQREEGRYVMARTTMLVLLVLSAVWAASVAGFADGPSAEEVLSKARAAWQGDSFHALVDLDVTQGVQTSSYRMEVWTKGGNDALLRILAPEDQAGSGYLMTEDEIWYYAPDVGTAVKLPSIALADSVFGAGPALDDLFRSTLSQDYSATMQTTSSGYVLTLTPRPDAAVVYGHLEIDVRDDFVLSRVVYYDQRDQILRTATFTDDVALADRTLPTTVTVVEANGDTTVERLIDPEFGVEIDASLFTVQSLENP